MLINSFCFLKKISLQKEKELWNKKIFTWEDYTKFYNYQISLLDNNDPFLEAKIALSNHDVLYFQNKLHPHDFFRLLLSFPEDVLFLDIETTGLSLYYDIITLIGWSINNEYDFYIKGMNIEPFKKKIQQAKMVVTFNGTLFDLKFLKKTFPDIKFPSCHVDLRFFSKRVGLQGGQKKIEEQLKYKRPKKIKNVIGENAPILWYEYCKGNQNAIRKLIEYNFYDIEGMKFILDNCINLFCKQKKFPSKITPSFLFSKKKTKLKITEVPKWNSNTITKITYYDLNAIIPLENFHIAGIDLVASEKKASGFCILKGNKAITKQIYTDDEIIFTLIKEKVKLVSIDSPLSIPKGRTSCWDDDVNRSYGITRECERILKKRGISSYPCLIPSMQKLTNRGIKLANKIRKLGIPVIESYPGAAQDIMQIPRKQYGIEYLKNGLNDFGIIGSFIKNDVTHDELDAITCSIVGQFFWTGMFEALGNNEEDFLIIPTNKINNKWLKRKCFVFSGNIGVGKTTAVEYLKQLGFDSNRCSKVLSQLLKELHIKNSRTNLQNLGIVINKFGFQRWLIKQVIKVLGESDKITIDGARFLEDIATLKEKFGPSVTHINISCNDIAIKNRTIETDNLPLKKVVQHKVETEIFTLAKSCDISLTNEGTLENFYKELKFIVRK